MKYGYGKPQMLTPNTKNQAEYTRQFWPPSSLTQTSQNGTDSDVPVFPIFTPRVPGVGTMDVDTDNQVITDGQEDNNDRRQAKLTDCKKFLKSTKGWTDQFTMEMRTQTQQRLDPLRQNVTNDTPVEARIQVLTNAVATTRN